MNTVMVLELFKLGISYKYLANRLLQAFSWERTFQLETIKTNPATQIHQPAGNIMVFKCTTAHLEILLKRTRCVQTWLEKCAQKPGACVMITLHVKLDLLIYKL